MGSRREIIGITGIIGSGKSTVCRILEKEFGFCWIDADKIVHELYRPGQPGYQKIKDYFGTQFVGKKGVHRGRLRRFILKTPQKLWILNKLIHSLVVHEVNKKIREKPTCIEAIYFDPKDLGKFIDRIVVIDAPDKKIFMRLAKRKIPRKQLIALLKFQRKNLPKSSVVIRNDGTLKQLVCFLQEQF
jgi:dephospho-CoA kinase